MKEVYLDNSATTMAYRSVGELVQKVMCEDYGNPSSMHNKGVEAEKYIKEFGAVNKAPLTYSIVQFGGHVNKAFDVAYVAAISYGDYQEDGKFGEDTAKAIASTVASGAAMTGIAIFAAGCSLPAAGAAAVSWT